MRAGIAALAIIAVGAGLAALLAPRHAPQRATEYARIPAPETPPPRPEAPPTPAAVVKQEPAAAQPASPPQPAPQQTALAVPHKLPRSAPPPAGEPAWVRYAVPSPPIEGRAMVAIVIDDVGVDHKGAEEAIRLPGPLTLSFMTYARDLPHLTAAAHAAGDELLLHVPMEPLNPRVDPGPNGLLTRLAPDEIRRRLRWDLDRASGYVGINNHMGSKFTADTAGMTEVMTELRARGLLFLDSRTIANSVGVTVAREMGVPHAARDVFLDNEIAPGPIDARLAEVEAIARRHGSVIAIGHPHKPTLAALAQWLPTLASKHLVLVPLTTIVRQRGPTG